MDIAAIAIGLLHLFGDVPVERRVAAEKLVRHVDLQRRDAYRSRVAMLGQYFHRVTRLGLHQELVVVPGQARVFSDTRRHLVDIPITVENADDLVRGIELPSRSLSDDPIHEIAFLQGAELLRMQFSSSRSTFLSGVLEKASGRLVGKVGQSSRAVDCVTRNTTGHEGRQGRKEGGTTSR